MYLFGESVVSALKSSAAYLRCLILQLAPECACNNWRISLDGCEEV